MRQQGIYIPYMVIFLMAVVFVVFVSAYTTPLHGYMASDDGNWTMFAKAVLYQGRIPYVEVQSSKGPVFFWIRELAEILGGRRMGSFLVHVPIFFVNLLLLYKTARLKLSVTNSYLVLAVAYFVFMASVGAGLDTETTSLPFVLVPMYFLVKNNIGNRLEDNRPVYGLLYGACFAIIAAIRANNAVVFLGMILALGVLMLKGRMYRLFLLNAWYAFLGFAIPAAVMGLVFYQGGYLWAFIEDCYTYHLDYIPHRAAESSDAASMLTKIGFMLPLIVYCGYFLLAKKTVLRACTFSAALFSIVTFVPTAGYWHYMTSFVPVYVLLGLVLITEGMKVQVRNLLLLGAILPYSFAVAREVSKSVVFIATRCWDDEYEIVHKALSVIPMEERAKNVLLYSMPGYRGFVVKEDVYSVSRYVYFDRTIPGDVWEDRMYQEFQKPEHDIRWYVTARQPKGHVLREYLDKRYEIVVSADTIKRGKPQGGSFLQKMVPNYNFTPNILVYKRKELR